MADNIDFGGYATRNNILCTDGLIIGNNAFAHNDGMIVPIFWQHQQNNISNLLGHGKLENRPDGVYVYGTFNDTKQGRDAKKAVMHGDVNALSIYANKLKKNNNVVTYGDIKEVSLVLSGANKGAYIDYRAFSHGDDGDFSEGIIYNDETFDYISHSEGGTNTMTDAQIDAIIDSMTDEQRELLFTIAGEQGDGEIEHSDSNKDFSEIDTIIDSMTDEQRELLFSVISDADDDGDSVEHADSSDETVGDVLDTLNEKQKKAVAYIIGQLVEGNEDEYDEDVEHSENMEEDDMKTNVFEKQTGSRDALAHAEEVKGAILADLKKCGSLSEAIRAHEEEIAEAVSYLEHGEVLQHDDVAGVNYGITNIDYLFPDARTISTTPDFIKREDAWVAKVMQGTSHTPFSRIKSMHADITADAARAKGYTKGHKKTEEVFALLKRSTTPTTIYKKQRLDRDDVIDITDFDVVLWLRAEMRIMLDEEIARAILVGDGRVAGTDDKISETNIRPIYTDDVLYTIRQQFLTSSSTTSEEKAKLFIENTIRSRKNYNGSGNPVLFTSEDMLTDMLLIKDGVGRDIYDTMEKLKNKLRVSDIITVPQFGSLTTDITTGTAPNAVTNTWTLDGIIVNLKDYAIGADKGGAVGMMDDFDIDYNQMKYLIETRCSGALIRPKSAIVVEHREVVEQQVPDNNENNGTTTG